jgi:transformation/transcription domain-associated protein
MRKQQAVLARANPANPPNVPVPPHAVSDGQPSSQTSPMMVHSSPPAVSDTPISQMSAPTAQNQVGEHHPGGAIRQSWEYVDEIVQILKTAFPLLVLSLETVVDQLSKRFKATPEEEQYRVLCILCSDAMQVGGSLGGFAGY